MAPQDLDSELHKKPGKTYEILERDIPMLWLGKRTVLIGFRVAETDPYFDRYEVVSLVHIVHLEPIPHPQMQAS